MVKGRRYIGGCIAKGRGGGGGIGRGSVEGASGREERATPAVTPLQRGRGGGLSQGGEGVGEAFGGRTPFNTAPSQELLHGNGTSLQKAPE